MLESGEYFLSQEQKAARATAAQQAKQAARVEERKRQREEAFVPPQVRCGVGRGRAMVPARWVGVCAGCWDGGVLL